MSLLLHPATVVLIASMCLHVMLAGVKESEWKDLAETAAVSQIFTGVLLGGAKCSSCSYNNIKWIPFTELSLPLSSDGSATTIEGLLER